MLLKAIVILLVGAGLGALMGHFGKCSDGACPLTANPYRGAMWGFLLALIVAYPLIVNSLKKPVPDSDNVIHPASEEDFDKTIASGVLLVDFYADWCGPCRMLASTINKLADEFQGRAKVVKVNVDKFPALARRFKANSIPNVVIIKDGVVVDRIVGLNKANRYSAALEKLLEPSADDAKKP